MNRRFTKACRFRHSTGFRVLVGLGAALGMASMAAKAARDHGIPIGTGRQSDE